MACQQCSEIEPRRMAHREPWRMDGNLRLFWKLEKLSLQWSGQLAHVRSRSCLTLKKRV